MKLQKSEKYKIKCVSSLTKVFPMKEPEDDLIGIQLSAFQNEVLSFQAAYKGNAEWMEYVTIDIKSDLQSYINIRQVRLMPSLFPCGPNADDNYLYTKPGLYPDLLQKVRDNKVQVMPGIWNALWIDIETSQKISEGDYSIDIILRDTEGRTLCSTSIIIKIYKGLLPQQKLKSTQWFHTDCLSNYYHVDPWSDEHWRIIDNFLTIYSKRGMNTILTPTFTPPLDTAVGGERTTVQLIDVRVESDNSYNFDFSQLKRWFDLCESHGIIYFEIAHLFTQWGAKHAPKIMAWKDGQYQRIFGWDTDAKCREYAEFLEAFLTELTGKLDQWDLHKRVYFHLSDEPDVKDIEAYTYAKGVIKKYLGEYPIIDALSNYEFYENGLVDNPVPANSHIDPFIENKVTGLWTYYCCGQESEVSNRFFSMPSARNRIIGVQLYKYDIEGFLHWGFNFYNTRHSQEQINPYAITDAGGSFQSGDPFLVYPGQDGKPEESIRIMVLAEAFQDIRAFEWLEALTSKGFVVKIIEDELDYPLTFKKYPKDNVYMLELRSKVNKFITEFIQKAE